MKSAVARFYKHVALAGCCNNISTEVVERAWSKYAQLGHPMRCPVSGVPYCLLFIHTQETSGCNVTMVAFEPLESHREEGANVLFQDGSVRFVRPVEYNVLLDAWRERGILEWCAPRPN